MSSTERTHIARVATYIKSIRRTVKHAERAVSTGEFICFRYKSLNPKCNLDFMLDSWFRSCSATKGNNTSRRSLSRQLLVSLYGWTANRSGKTVAS